MTPDATRRRSIGQILLLAAGFLVLVAISATSVILVDQAREDNRWVVHTVEVENQISTLLLQVRRAESAARGYLLTSDPRFLAEHDATVATILPDIDKLDRPDQRQSGSDRKRQTAARAGRGAAAGIRQGHRLRQAQRHRRRHRDAARSRRQPIRRANEWDRQRDAGGGRTSCSRSAPRRRIAPSGLPRS